MEEQKLLKRRRKALQENNEALLVNACTDLANFYMDNGRYDFAIEEYTTVANIYEQQNKKLEYAVVNRGIGEAYLGLQKFTKALQYQKIYLNTVKEIKNKLEEQRALATIGHTFLSSYLDSPEPDKSSLNLANKFFRKSLVVSQSLSGEVSKIEVADMSARLFCNLGLVQECLGNFDQASDLINKSINLCKIHDLYEQLQRGYVAYASLLIKMDDYKLALQQYNLAAEAAKKIRSKPSLLAGVLLSKSEILVKLGDLHGAKSALLKAYRLKIPDSKERKTIENNLRVVASMCYKEDKLLTTESTDYSTLKSLYEKMGDGCCELKQFEKAIDYYKKMLDAATKANLTGSDLASCYYSLAETFKDNGQYAEAVSYFEKELQLCQSLKDSLNTLSKIVDTKETANAPATEVQAIYNEAIERCRKEGDRHEEGRMVKRCIAYLRRQNQHSEAFKLEQILSTLNFQSSDSESEGSEAQAGSVLGADIDLDAITDLSEDSDAEQPTKTRRRNKTFQLRRNIKGETQLHTACIKGQINVVRHLLEQGHPVNVRDHCGWLPLHEACIHGHIDVVQLLLEKGAAINDRGGTQCEGVTPLHDAASNGHLSIVQLLLKKGANAVAKTDEGDSVLNFLKKWRYSVQLDDGNQKLYESLVEQISQALEKVGHSVDQNRMPEFTSPMKNLRKSAIIGLEDENSPPPSTSRRSSSFGLEEDNFPNHVNDYRDTIESLKRRTESGFLSRTTSTTKRSALLSSNDVVDDWLEDDVGKSVKKRKTNSPTKSRKTTSPAMSRHSPSPVKSHQSYSPAKSHLSYSPAKSHTSKRSNEGFLERTNSFDDVEMLFEDDFASSYYQPPPNPTQSNTSKTIKNKKPRQTKLTNFGHTRTLVEADSTGSPRTNRTNSCNSLSRTSSFDNNPSLIDPTLFVDVRINQKLYRVPVLLSQINTHTIKWLADEAAARYSKKEYMIPTLELETKNGAVLADEDSISLLFPMGTMQAEEVEAKIIKWNIPTLTERFKEACQDMGVTAREDICRVLEEMSVNLDLANKGLKGANLVPLCKVLNRQTNLLELDLSGNFLTNECFRFLGISMASLENLHKLNLNCTGLQSEHIQILIGGLVPDVAYKLTDLDMSDNYLGNQCFESMAILTRRFLLKKLNLSGNKFTRNIFAYSFNQQFTLNLDQVEFFDVSNNDFSNEALIKVLSWLNFPSLKSLNISRTSVTEGFMKEVLSNCFESCQLRVCKISRCHVQDSDLFNLLRIASSLEHLDASYNNSLTGISLRKLLQSNITTLDLYGCENILQYFPDLTKYLDENESSVGGKTLKLTLPANSSEESEYLIQLWNHLYDNKAIVELGYRLLHLSVSN